MNIMIVNHDSEMLGLLAEVLEERGHRAYKIDRDNDLDEIVDEAYKTKPTVILFDLGRPPQEERLGEWRELCAMLAGFEPVRGYVLTTTNSQIKNMLTKRDLEVCPAECVIDQPGSIDALLNAVMRASNL